MARRPEPDGPSITAASLTPERHADAGPDVEAARDTLAAVLEVVAEETLQPPGVRLNRNALAETSVERKLRGRVAHTARRRARDRQPEAARGVHPSTCGRMAHAIDHVEIWIEREDVTTSAGQPIEREARLEGQRAVSQESPPDVDRCSNAERAAVRSTAAAVMAIRCTKIDADFVLRTAGGGDAGPLGQRDVRERHQGDCRHQSTRELPHNQDLQLGW